MRSVSAFLLVVVALAGCVAPGPSQSGGVTFRALEFQTELGAFTAILFEDETPLTAAFIERLVTAKYYDGRQFGRVIPGFVIQEVDRTGGTTDQPERVKGEFGTRVMFSGGALGIARDADPDSGSSEFFVMDFAASALYGNYTAFAQVVEGMDIVHAIARVPAVKTGPASSVAAAPPGSPVAFGVHDRVPVDPVVMTKVTLVDVTLPAGVAARYPLLVGETVRTDTVRATLEWPADLRAGQPSILTWYVSPRDTSPQAQAQGQVQDLPPLDLEGATVVIANVTLTPTEDAKAPGVLTFAWAPSTSGEHVARLVKDGQDVVTANVTVTG